MATAPKFASGKGRSDSTGSKAKYKKCNKVAGNSPVECETCIRSLHLKCAHFELNDLVDQKQ